MVGRTILSYRIGGVLGAGGMGVVRGPRSDAGSRGRAVLLSDIQEEPMMGIGIFRLSDGKLGKTINQERLGSFLRNGRRQWAPDGKSLVFIQTDESKNVSNLWILPLDGTGSRPLTHFESDRIFSYALSPDGKMLATSRGHTSGDIVLMRNFR